MEQQHREQEEHHANRAKRSAREAKQSGEEHQPDVDLDAYGRSCTVQCGLPGERRPNMELPVLDQIEVRLHRPRCAERRLLARDQ